jgi:hypothetical protein
MNTWTFLSNAEIGRYRQSLKESGSFSSFQSAAKNFDNDLPGQHFSSKVSTLLKTLSL